MSKIKESNRTNTDNQVGDNQVSDSHIKDDRNIKGKITSPTVPTGSEFNMSDFNMGEVLTFLAGVIKIARGLEVPSFPKVLSNLGKTSIVIVISSILFAIIDSIVAPIAKFLLNG